MPPMRGVMTNEKLLAMGNVMLGVANGGQLERKHVSASENYWEDANPLDVTWNWLDNDYRIKPVPRELFVSAHELADPDSCYVADCKTVRAHTNGTTSDDADDLVRFREVLE